MTSQSFGKSFVMLSQNGALILNWKENKEAVAICFEIRMPSKKTRNYYEKCHQKFMEVILSWKKTE
jgi:hypothetical protein